MTNAKTFGSVLSGIRKEQGYSSAHQFFKSVGGSKNLGLAFVSYWDMERGKKLPKSWRLKAIIAALGIDKHSPKAKELVRAYFRALSGSDELIQILSAPASAGVDLPSRELAEAATHQAIARRSVNLTLEQWKLRARDTVTHICQIFLVNTTGWVPVRELAEATGFKPEEIRKALKALASGGLIEFSVDKARSLFADKVIKALPKTPETAQIRVAMRKNWNTWLADSKLAGTKTLTLRMTKANFDIYFQHLEKAVDLACIYEEPEANKQESEIYYIRADIFSVLPRD
ncbi:MAG TPA: hypothetical protein DCL44_10775 [Elusimicrobia bacterium]|nr:hypothetical protein [Elusimicrobiota bacterium]